MSEYTELLVRYKGDGLNVRKYIHSLWDGVLIYSNSSDNTLEVLISELNLSESLTIIFSISEFEDVLDCRVTSGRFDSRMLGGKVEQVLRSKALKRKKNGWG